MKENSGKYVAIIGDLVGSRDAPDRAALQSKLNDSLSAANKKFTHRLFSKFILTAGDEFQAIAEYVVTAFKITQILKDELFPHPVRFGIGYGSLKIFPEDREFAIGFDGEAFWRARTAIEESKKCGVSVVFHTGTEYDEILKSIQRGIDWIAENRTHKQATAAILYNNGLDQKEIAERMNTKQPGITRFLKKGGYFVEKDLSGAIIKAIEILSHGINNLQ
ncbi:MAG TPA: hypothetical protein ENN07_02485 [candidate division Zixibacteria bacterium]|nr:hypothetical protein [candidate division Zixibacteria bacterium]